MLAITQKVSQKLNQKLSIRQVTDQHLFMKFLALRHFSYDNNMYTCWNTMALQYTSLFFYIKMPLKIKTKRFTTNFLQASVFICEVTMLLSVSSRRETGFWQWPSVRDSHTYLHRGSLLKPFVSNEKSDICYAALVRWSEHIRLLTFVMNGIWSLTNSSFTW